LTKQSQQCFATGIVATLILATGGILVSPYLSAAVLVAIPSITVVWIYQSQKKRLGRNGRTSPESHHFIGGAITPEVVEKSFSSLSEPPSNLIMQVIHATPGNHVQGKPLPSSQVSALQWLQENVPRVPHDATHCFVENEDIVDLEKRIVPAARQQIVAVQPSIVQDDLGELLWNAALDGVEVILITCPPGKASDGVEKSTQWHNELARAGVDITYRNDIKSDVLVVDISVAVVSAPTPSGRSESERAWQPGLVTFEQHVVDNVLASVLRLLN
jgi:hypothetical protein